MYRVQVYQPDTGKWKWSGPYCHQESECDSWAKSLDGEWRIRPCLTPGGKTSDAWQVFASIDGNWLPEGPVANTKEEAESWGRDHRLADWESWEVRGVLADDKLRFQRKLLPQGDCVVWQGPAAFWWRGAVRTVAQASWDMQHGSLPEGGVTATCGTKNCVRHLAVTRKKQVIQKKEEKKKKVTCRLTLGVRDEMRYIASQGYQYAFLAEKFNVDIDVVEFVCGTAAWRNMSDDKKRDLTELIKAGQMTRKEVKEEFGFSPDEMKLLC